MDIKVTTDGLHKLNQASKNVGSLVIMVSGTSTATAQLCSVDMDGAYIDYIDGLVAIGDQVVLTAGGGDNVFVRINGADGTTPLNFRVNPA